MTKVIFGFDVDLGRVNQNKNSNLERGESEGKGEEKKGSSIRKTPLVEEVLYCSNEKIFFVTLLP
ncbi:hypothetical protein IPN35_00655 [Candidatus Peregrinibacteria bacterium]|nr:MAG: hypothetical protein IPN35_00655 [Candidatus Peregrinibacteria bacterium]